MIHYYQLHGCKVERLNHELYHVVIPVRCSALTDKNLCSLHGTEEKPKVCCSLDERTKSRYYITEGCILQ